MMANRELGQLSISDLILPESDPVLPVELFSKIIDILGERPPGSPLSHSQSSLLQTCALVCKSFGQLARDKLFHHIKIGLHAIVEKRFVRFAKILKANPALSSSIRELVVQLDSFGGGTISEDDFSQHRDILLDLPRLQSLVVLFNSRFTSPPDLYISEFCYNLIDHYSARKMLRSLHVKTMDELPYNNIFASPVLRDFSVDRCLELDEWRAPVPGLQKLILRKMDIDPTLIACFPNLTDLHILRTNFFEQESGSKPPLSLPKFSITRLTLEPSSYHGGRFLPFISFIRQQAIKHGFKPFERVESLKVILSHPTRDLESLLQDTVRLTHLTLQVDEPEDVSVKVILEVFEACIRTSLSLAPMLGRISLDFNLDWHTYGFIMEQLFTLFSSPISPLLHDNLGTIDLSFPLDVRGDADGSRTDSESGDAQVGSDTPTKEWSAIESIVGLIHSHSFPKLEEVNVNLSFDDAVTDSTRMRLQSSLQMLADKGNFVLNSQLEEIVDEVFTHRAIATYRRSPT